MWIEFYEAGDENGLKKKIGAYGPYYAKILANYELGSIAGRLTAQNGKFLFYMCVFSTEDSRR